AVIDPDAATVTPPGTLSRKRSDSCSALLEDGGALLVVGGAWKDNTGLHSAQEVDVISPAGEVNTPRALRQARHGAACLRLNDGSILVTGGLQYVEGSGSIVPVTINSAEIYR